MKSVVPMLIVGAVLTAMESTRKYEALYIIVFVVVVMVHALVLFRLRRDPPK